MEAYHATTLLLLAAGAFFIPLLSERVHVPAAVGEILYGILIAEHGLGLIAESQFTHFLGDFGFAFLMFLAGLEIDFVDLERLGRKGLSLVGIAAASVFLLSFGLVSIMSLPIFYVLVLSAMSLGLALVALRDTELGATRLGQSILVAGSFGEFLTIVLLTVTDLSALHGTGLDLALGLVKLGLVFVVAYILLVVLRTLVWWHPKSFERIVRSQDSSEIGIRASFAMMLAFIAVAALLGVEAILGAFVAGALMSFVFREKEVIEEKMSAFGFGFFVPIFFIEVGTRFDFSTVFQQEFVALLAFFLVAGFVVRAAPMLLFRFLGLSFREILSTGIILSAPLTLLIAISQVGLHTGLIDSTASATIVLYAVVGGILFPVLFRRVAPRR
jgi:Kef-type K+ transport system membrane component KefB